MQNKRARSSVFGSVLDWLEPLPGYYWWRGWWYWRSSRCSNRRGCRSWRRWNDGRELGGLMSDVDYGLLGGLAEGLKAGFTSYQKAKEDAQDRALKRRQEKLMLMEKGMQVSANDPESR